MINVGLIGFGFSGRTFHAPVISAVPGMRVAAILQRHTGDAKSLYPDARVVNKIEDLLSDDIELVVIATPNTSHAGLARQCLLAKRHVVVDKPFTTTLREASELVGLSQKCGRILSVYQNSRWHGDFLTVRQLVSSGALGRVVLYEAHYDRYRTKLRPGAWRERVEPGSGVWFDLGPHLVDQAGLLFGPPEAVTAEIRTERDGAVVDDAFDVVLHYPQMRALLRATMLACSPGPRFLLNGTRGTYVKHGIDPQEEALKRGEIPGHESWGKEPRDNWGTLTTAEESDVAITTIPTEAGDYRGYYMNVRDVILGKADIDVNLRQALDVMRILEMAQESSRKRCTVPWSSPA